MQHFEAAPDQSWVQTPDRLLLSSEGSNKLNATRGSN